MDPIELVHERQVNIFCGPVELRINVIDQVKGFYLESHGNKDTLHSFT